MMYLKKYTWFQDSIILIDLVLLFRSLGARSSNGEGTRQMTLFIHEREESSETYTVVEIVDRRFGLTRSSTLVCTSNLNVLVGHACAPELPPSFRTCHRCRCRASRAHVRRRRRRRRRWRSHMCTYRRRGYAYTFAEWRQEPRRHVTGAPPLRSSCRRGFAPAALRRATQRRRRRPRPQNRGGKSPDSGSSRPYLQHVRAYWCTRYILRGVRSTSRPVDARRPKKSSRVLPIVQLPSNTRIRLPCDVSLRCMKYEENAIFVSISFLGITVRVNWKTRSRCLHDFYKPLFRLWRLKSLNALKSCAFYLFVFVFSHLYICEKYLIF